MSKITCKTYAVKYSRLDYDSGKKRYIIYQQCDRYRRYVPERYCFEDDGECIWVSSFYAEYFTYRKKPRFYVLDDETGEFERFCEVEVEKHVPGKIKPSEDNSINELKK